MEPFLIRILADGLVVVVFLIAIYMFVTKIPRRQWTWWGLRIMAAGITAYGAKEIIAHLFQPEQLRPFEQLGVPAGAAYLQNAGFPSDHALFAMFLVLAVWFSTKNRSVTLLMLVLTILMGFGRVLALVHTPLDIVGGFLIAPIGIVWYFVGQRPVDEKHKK